MQVDSMREQIRSFIIRTFPLARRRSIAADDPLLESGIIDSLGVLNLIAYLHGEFKIEMSDEDLVPENFQTIERLAAFALRKLTPTATAAYDDDDTLSRS